MNIFHVTCGPAVMEILIVYVVKHVRDPWCRYVRITAEEEIR